MGICQTLTALEIARAYSDGIVLVCLLLLTFGDSLDMLIFIHLFWINKQGR